MEIKEFRTTAQEYVNTLGDYLVMKEFALADRYLIKAALIDAAKFTST